MNFRFILYLSLISVLIDSMAANGALPARIPIYMKSIVSQDQFRKAIDGRPQWKCEFDQDYCGVKNSYHLASFERHSDPRSPMFGQRSMLFVNVTNANNYPAARLQTDYFDAGGQRSGCLSIEYLMYGTGALKLFVIQQDIQNKCLFADFNESVDNSGQWRGTQMNVDLRDGNPRFFIEAHINGRPPHYGTIAIKSISFSYGICDFDDTNNCRRREERPIPPPEPTPV